MERNSLSIFIVTSVSSITTDQGIVHPDQWQPMLEGFPQPRVEHFAKAGHCIMLEDTDPIMHKLKNFLDEDKLTA